MNFPEASGSLASTRLTAARSLRWTLLAAVIAAGAAALVLVFLLTVATNNKAMYERHYQWLFWANVGIAATLAAVITTALIHLARRVQRGKFGSRLLFKLAATFAFVGVLPGALIYGVSYQFVSRSIESWFDVQVEGALEAGLNLGRDTLQSLVQDLAGKTRVAAERASESGERLNVLALERLREQLSAQSVAVLSSSGHVLSSAGGSLGAALLPDRPNPNLLRQARQAKVASALEGLDDDSSQTGRPAPNALIRAVAWIPSANYSSLGISDRFLQVTQQVSPQLASNALRVQSAYSEYQQRALGRQGLRKMYIGTLTLALILGVFSALLMAAALGHQLARPLLVLAEGVRQVARGDLRPTEVFHSRDELGGLTRSFADMTQQLADARSMVQRSLADVESAKGHLQTILDNLSAGVIVFNADDRLDIVNPGATRILRVPLLAYQGFPLTAVPNLADLAHEVEQRFQAAQEDLESGPDAHWQDTLEVALPGTDSTLTLLVRGATLPDGQRLIVFDDITEVVSAQRSVAWAEVARRLAHEIKNPLTPIQLSAERLQFKLEPKLDQESDRQMLARSVTTIVNQVQSMKTLVNEFRDYARLPAARLHPLDLNALVKEVLGLYSVQQESGVLSARLEPNLPPIAGDPTQLRQVIHNLVQNALDAVAGQYMAEVCIRTVLRPRNETRPDIVKFIITDNGPGFSEKVLKRAFEPYVTTKSRGTGLGLAVVKKIIEEHGARIRLRNRNDSAGDTSFDSAQNGAEVSISFSRWERTTSAASGATV